MTVTNPEVLVRVENLKVYYPILGGLLRRQVGAVKAVDNVSFDIYRGETFGVVGESGCGKSTTGLAILKLLQITSGKVSFRGTDITSTSPAELRKMRRHMQMIFQDPYSSLNPRMTVGSIIAEPLSTHKVGTPAEQKARVEELLRLVGLNPSFINRYPHEFSGGQRQRIGIARALATNPDFIVADEPISALDVSIQAQVVNLMKELKSQLGLTYMFVAHDLSMVRYISDRVAVMYLGKIVELGDRRDVFTTPLHPYTRALLSAVPIPDPKKERERRRTILEGDVPSPARPPQGCRFHPRCAFAEDRCRQEEPYLRTFANGQQAACHLVEKL